MDLHKDARQEIDRNFLKEFDARRMGGATPSATEILMVGLAATREYIESLRKVIVAQEERISNLERKEIA